MSESLDAVDLSGIAVNGTGSVDLSKLKTAYNNPSSQELAHIRLYNDSGSTLKIRSDSGLIQDYIPAGAWLTYPIDHSTQSIDFTVINILPNPPIQLLMPTYFSPGEEVPDTPQLGNSPVGIGGTVSTSNIQTLSNDGNPVGTEVVEMSVGGIKTVSWLNTPFLKLLGSSAAGNEPIFQLKDNNTGRTYNIFLMTDGSLLWQEAVNGTFGLRLFPDGHFTSDGGAVATAGSNGIILTPTLGGGNKNAIEIKPTDASAKDWILLYVEANNELQVRNNTDGIAALELQPSGIGSVANGALSWDAVGNANVHSLLSTGDIELVNGGGGSYRGQTGGFLQAFSKFTGTTTGTYSHGLGIQPTHVDPMQHAVGSQTMGWDSETSTQVHITSGNGAAFSAMAFNI